MQIHSEPDPQHCVKVGVITLVMSTEYELEFEDSFLAISTYR